MPGIYLTKFFFTLQQVKKMKQVLIFIILVIVCSCSTDPYKTSNKSYKKQTKDYAKVLAEYPLKDFNNKFSLLCRYYEFQSSQTKFCYSSSHRTKRL